MQALLTRIGIDRDAVESLGEPAARPRTPRVGSAAAGRRDRAVAGAADQADFVAQPTPRCESLAVIEAANAEEEALAIAVALREAVEAPGKTAALVTPDRALARRVLAALARWNVAVDDSGGDPLSDTPAGVFARLAAEVALDGLPPVTLLALLKHPLCRLDAGDARLGAGARGAARPAAARGTAGLAHALADLPRRTREAQPQRTVLAAPLRSARGDHAMPNSMRPTT